MENLKLEYKIIVSDGQPIKIENAVAAAIADGWQPCGGICVTTHQGSGTVSYYQAMTRGLLALFPVEVHPAAQTATPAPEISTATVTAPPVAFAVTPATEKRSRKAKGGA